MTVDSTHTRGTASGLRQFRYTVRCQFSGPDETLPEQWLEWLCGGHLQEVLDAGAQRAEVVRIDDPLPTFEVRYEFPSREAFESYEKRHAPRLRREGLARFPAEAGVRYQRTTGEVVVAPQAARRPT
jgi:hypothetical protein